MMNGGGDNLETLVRQVLPQVTPCPRGMVVDALCAAAKEFCEQASVWRGRIEGSVMPGDWEMPLCVPDGARVARVLAVWLEGNEMDRSAYSVEGAHVCFSQTFPRERRGVAEVVLRPTRTARGLPGWLVEEWGDVIAQGALARLQAMSGPKVEWSNPGASQMALAEYNQGVGRARIRAMRRR